MFGVCNDSQVLEMCRIKFWMWLKILYHQLWIDYDVENLNYDHQALLKNALMNVCVNHELHVNYMRHLNTKLLTVHNLFYLEFLLLLVNNITIIVKLLS